MAHSAKPETTCSGMWGEVLCRKGTWKVDVRLDRILKPWQATSFEPWQAMVVRHCGSGTGCMAVQWMMSNSCTSSGRLQRASMAPALLELLWRYGRLPPSEPVAEYIEHRHIPLRNSATYDGWAMPRSHWDTTM